MSIPISHLALHRPDQQHLFSEGGLHEHLARREARVSAALTLSEVQSAPAPTEADLYEAIRVRPPALIEGAIRFLGSSTKIDVRNDPLRGIPDRSRPCLVDGIRADFIIPLTGEEDLLRFRPSQYTLMPPRGRVSKTSLVLTFENPGVDPEWVRPAFERELGIVREWLQWLHNDCEVANKTLQRTIARELATRAAITRSLRSLSEDFATHEEQERAARPAPVAPAEPAIPNRPHEQWYEVALSFAGENREYVERVADTLRARDVTVFYDQYERTELWGKDLVEHLAEIYKRRARFVVMFISEHYIKKPWPKHEKRAALEGQLYAKKEFLLPVRFDSTEVPGLSDTISYVDANRVEPLELVEMILDKLRIE